MVPAQAFAESSLCPLQRGHRALNGALVLGLARLHTTLSFSSGCWLRTGSTSFSGPGPCRPQGECFCDLCVFHNSDLAGVHRDPQLFQPSRRFGEPWLLPTRQLRPLPPGLWRQSSVLRTHCLLREPRLQSCPQLTQLSLLCPRRWLKIIAHSVSKQRGKQEPGPACFSEDQKVLLVCSSAWNHSQCCRPGQLVQSRLRVCRLQCTAE